MPQTAPQTAPPTAPPSAHSPVRSTVVNRVSEMTMISEIRQGFTVPLAVGRNAKGGVGSIGHDRAAPKVRFVDNLRTAFTLIGMEVASGGEIILDDIATIHFARWVILPGDRQLLFTSNFDGGWEQYIHDFVTIANSDRPTTDNKTGTPWMDLVWGNCVDYPGTTDFAAFLNWIQASMIPTTLFFPTISDVTVRDVSWLRRFRGLYAEFDDAALRVDRRTWPPDLLHAYDRFKSAVNRIDVTDV